MSIFFNPDLASLEAYTPGEQPQGMKYIKLKKYQFIITVQYHI